MDSAGAARVGRDKNSGLCSVRPKAMGGVGMEGDGAWPAVPICFCPGPSKLSTTKIISTHLNVIDAQAWVTIALADLRVRQGAGSLVSVRPTVASQADKDFLHYNVRALKHEPAAEDLTATGSVRDRLLVALADPAVAGKSGRSPATLVAFQEPMAVLEWLGTGKGLVILDLANIPEEDLPNHLLRILQAHEKGLLFVAVAGGGPDVPKALKAADAETRNHDHIGLYHVDLSGKVHWVAGRRLGELEKAGRDLPRTPPLSADDVAAIVERGRKERQEAVDFVRGTARRFPHLTVGIIAVCVLLFAITSGNDERAHRIYNLLCNQPVGVRQGELWRLLTYAFLHDTRSATHLIVNMLSLYSLGSLLEPLLGRTRLGLLFALTAVAGGVASTLFLGMASVGASGAVWGLVGATFGLLSGRQQTFPALIARGLRQRLVVILAINIAISFLPSIDRYCHFGGGIAGYLLALYFVRKPL